MPDTFAGQLAAVPRRAGAEDKLAQIDRRPGRDGPVGLGATIPVGPQQEASTRHDH